MKFTLIIPYYRNPAMLERQSIEWVQYPPNVEVIVVDDGSPEPAEDVVKLAYQHGANVRLLRINEDIPWNRNGARNLGALQARTDWILQTDIDHILPVATAHELQEFNPDRVFWYRFTRYRVGKADFTRKKDDIPDDMEFGKIKPHMDSYLVERDTYCDLGGYDEDYSGSLGGGTPFVKELEAKRARIDLPDPYALHVYTTHAVKDASDIHLSRDHARYTLINRRKKFDNVKPPMCSRFTWKEIEL